VDGYSQLVETLALHRRDPAMNVDGITRVLVEQGTRVFNGPAEFVVLTQLREADELLNDLTEYPHAYVLACVMDRQIKAEKAWLIPYRFAQKLGDFSFQRLARLNLDEIRELMTKPEPLHRYTEEMSKNFHAAVELLGRKYSGNAARIWADNPSSADVVYRFLEFRGVGPKIATMAANILARHFKIPFSDYFSIDISVDVHIKRVFARLGLIDPDDSVEAVIYRARALHPKFPGLFDLPAWEIGRNWCRSQTPLCGDCYMREVCPSALPIPNPAEGVN
jgi:endonuclease-3